MKTASDLIKPLSQSFCKRGRATQILRRGNFRLGERDRLGRRGRRPADRLLPVLYDSYLGIQA